MAETPFEGGGFIPPARGTELEKRRAVLAVCSTADRVAFDRVDAAAQVLQALGLIAYRPARAEVDG